MSARNELWLNRNVQVNFLIKMRTLLGRNLTRFIGKKISQVIILEIHLYIGLKFSKIQKGMNECSEWAVIKQERSGKPPD